MNRSFLVLVALAFRLSAYDLAVSTDRTVNPQGQGGRINYVPVTLANVDGCGSPYTCAIFDTTQYSGMSFGGGTGSNQEIAVRPVSGGSAICITCGRHVDLFGSDYSAGIQPHGYPANVGTPVFDPTGNWLAMLVADPVLINSFGCPYDSANAGTGYCMNIVVCKFNPGFTSSGGVSGDALSSCTNETNFPHSTAGGQKGSLHPRWGNSQSPQMFARTQKDADSDPNCGAVEACSYGVWSLHIGTISNASYSETFSTSGISGNARGWFESGNFGGQRSRNLASNSDNGFFTFVSNTGDPKQPWYCPDMWAVHYADSTFSQLTSTGHNCLTDPSNAAWNEHPTFSPDSSVISYVSALNNGWTPGPPGAPQTPLDIWEASIAINGSSAAISNQTRLTYYNGTFTSQAENSATPLLIMSQMQWSIDGLHILHITSCVTSEPGCMFPYGDRELVLNPLQVLSGGVANSADYQTPVAPGSIAAVFGYLQLVGALGVTAFPIPTDLGGLSIQFGSVNAPLFYVGPTQANVQVPWELAGQSQTTVTASIGNQTAASIGDQNSAPQTVALATYAPGLYALNGAGTGPGAILDSNYNKVTSSNPAKAGDTVQLYGTGFGPVTNQPATGAAAPSDPNKLAETTTKPTVTIGGLSALVEFSGLTPGAVGLYQINVQIPQGVATGDSVNVSASIGGAQSNTVTIAIH